MSSPEEYELLKFTVYGLTSEVRKLREQIAQMRSASSLEPDEILTSKQVMDILGITFKTLANLEKSNGLKYFQFTEKGVKRYRRADILEFMEACRK